MANSKKIVVEVIGRDIEYASNGGGTSRQIKNSNGQINLNSLLSPTKSAEKEIIATNLLIERAERDIAGLIRSSVMYALNRRYNLNEDYMAQQDMSNILTGIGKTASLGASIIAGAKLGSGIGAYGALIGGTIGTFAWVGSEAVSVIQKFDQAYIQINENNYESSFQRTRLGLNDNGRGTQN